MQYDLKKEYINKIKEIISEYTDVQEIILYGSRAKNTNKKYSDIDIALKGKNISYNITLDIKHRLEEETYIPYFFDVINYNTINSQELIKEIDKYGIKLK